MKDILKYTIVFLFLSICSVYGQISPGDLSEAHREFEGIFKCTNCHVLGHKISNDKCLQCHSEIKELVDEKRGYHASIEVKNNDCASCHSGPQVPCR